MFGSTALAAQEVFISEIAFYPTSNELTDAVEIAGPAGVDLNGWQLAIYDGATGTVYQTIDLNTTDILVASDVIDGQAYGVIIKELGVNGIRGRTDGVALVNPQQQLQEFWSYDGVFRAVEGAAAGLLSRNIGNTRPLTALSGTTYQRNCIQFNGGPFEVQDVCYDPIYDAQQVLDLLGSAVNLDIDSSLVVAVFEAVEENLGYVRQQIEDAQGNTDNLPIDDCLNCDEDLVWTEKRMSLGYEFRNYDAARLTLRVDNSDVAGLLVRKTFQPDKIGLMVTGGGNAALLEGDVEILGTTSTENLNVNTMIYTHELKVQVPPFPDYVFAEDYKLPTIAETAQFIKNNHHLPNFPTAAEVAKDGLLIGDFQVKQTEKIEELFLHLIEMDKRLQALEAENKALKDEIKTLKH